MAKNILSNETYVSQWSHLHIGSQEEEILPKQSGNFPQVAGKNDEYHDNKEATGCRCIFVENP